MDSPIRGQTRELTHKVEATVPMNIHNRFDVEVIDSRTGKIRQRAHGENVICSQLWTRLLTPTTYFNYIHYGTGTGTPASTDTSLFTFKGYDTAVTDGQSIDRAACVYSLRRKIQLSETTAVGSTITEIGIGYSTSSTSLCTHAMLKDANGNQISIAKTNTDIINIYATVYAHWNSALNSGNVLFSGNSYFLMALCGLYDETSLYYRCPTYAQLCRGRSLTASNTEGDITVCFGVSSIVCSAASKTMTMTFNRLGANYGNRAGGSEYILLSSYLNSVYLLYGTFALKAGAGWFPGTDIVAEPIATGDGIAVDFATDFDCPTNATIYVDGVAASDVTVDNVPLNYDHMEYYFEEVIISNGVAYPAISDGHSTGYSLYGQRTVSPLNSIYKYSVFYNPFYQHGIKTYYSYADQYVEVSDDLLTWTTLSTTSGMKTVPEAYRNYKYWRLTSFTSSDAFSNFTANALTGKNIHFTTPSANGAVITADYHTPVIAKDANHVFDLSVTIQLGEYTS